MYLSRPNGRLIFCGGVLAHRPTRCFNSRRRAACPHAADSPNFMCSNGKTLPHPARCATFSPGAKATTDFSSRRSCHGVTDEVKSCGMMSFSARLSRRAACPHAADAPNFMCSNGKTLPHPARCATFSPGAKATTGFSSRRSCHGVTDEVKSHDLMLLTAV